VSSSDNAQSAPQTAFVLWPAKWQFTNISIPNASEQHMFLTNNILMWRTLRRDLSIKCK